ncbi:hypothetical protein SKAU_G00279300 [Synaphobranchus kaupii]|uniref:HAT C-terminal dimerisation domain-containing protein n=1 Tax=Synaphobranchus kaupii TaxID=118154 RepID=A0A9Q1EWW9_SYNKA|nr:hypothetical protein SKAU_G00279300 [Synaphobranchus kaupii]
MLREKLHSIEGDRAAHDSPHPDDPPAKRSRADGNNNSLMGMFDEILEENSDATAHQENKSVDADLESYLSEPTLHLSQCPLEYWRTNQSRFKCLAQLARKYLSAPCTSVDSERLFSAAGHVMDERRNRLTCEKAEMLLFLKKNLPLIHPELTKKVEE